MSRLGPDGGLKTSSRRLGRCEEEWYTAGAVSIWWVGLIVVIVLILVGVYSSRTMAQEFASEQIEAEEEEPI